MLILSVGIIGLAAYLLMMGGVTIVCYGDLILAAILAVIAIKLILRRVVKGS